MLLQIKRVFILGLVGKKFSVYRAASSATDK